MTKLSPPTNEPDTHPNLTTATATATAWRDQRRSKAKIDFTPRDQL
jgi:hypothetical protein